MSGALVTALMFGSFFLLLAIGIPLAWGLCAIGILFGFLIAGTDIFMFITLRIWSIFANIAFIAVPLFVFMAAMLEASGIADRLYDAIHVWMGPVRGSLAMATVVVCAILAACLGTAGAGVCLMGLIALPVMLRHKYDKTLALGCIMAGGGLGVLIPPSMMLVLYGLFSGVSIGKLFMGGIGAGTLLAVLFIIYIGIRCYLKPELGPALPKEERSLSIQQKIALARHLILPVMLILAVSGAIFAGIATPAEVAGVGAVGAMICAAIHHNLTWENLKEAAYTTMRTLGIVMWIAFGAAIFVGVYTYAGGGDFLANLIASLQLGTIGTLTLLMLIEFLLGMVIDVIGLVILCVPIFTPIVASLGIDPLWFGILFNVNMQMAYLSPPFGYGMFYLKGVTPPEISIEDIYRSVWPFMGLQAIGLGICILFPPIATWLPRMMVK